MSISPTFYVRLFCTKVSRKDFFVLTFKVWNFLAQEYRRKCAHKMLVKLTLGLWLFTVFSLVCVITMSLLVYSCFAVKSLYPAISFFPQNMLCWKTISFFSFQNKQTNKKLSFFAIKNFFSGRNVETAQFWSAIWQKRISDETGSKLRDRKK